MSSFTMYPISEARNAVVLTFPQLIVSSEQVEGAGSTKEAKWSGGVNPVSLLVILLRKT